MDQVSIIYTYFYSFHKSIEVRNTPKYFQRILKITVSHFTTKSFLRCIRDIQESIFILHVSIYFMKSCRHTCKTVLLHKQMYGICRLQCHSVSDNFVQLVHCEITRYQELCFVQVGKVCFFPVTFNYDRNLVGELCSYSTAFAHPGVVGFALLERNSMLYCILHVF